MCHSLRGVKEEAEADGKRKPRCLEVLLAALLLS